MQLNEQSVQAYFTLMTDPETHGLSFRALDQCFEKSETVTAQHKLFADYKTEVPQIQKIFFYIVMERFFGPCEGKDSKGNLGFHLKFKPKPELDTLNEPTPFKNMLEKKGLVKLTEECGELIQIASKKQTCMNTDIHYDGLPLASRLEDEIGDVLAACAVVIENFGLNSARINNRAEEKRHLFEKWMQTEE